MNEMMAWDNFKNSGRVEDYLEYKFIENNSVNDENKHMILSDRHSQIFEKGSGCVN